MAERKVRMEDGYADVVRPKLLNKYSAIIGLEIAEPLVDFVFGFRRENRGNETEVRGKLAEVIAKKLGGNLQERVEAVTAFVLITELIARQEADDATPWDHLEQI